MRHLPALLAVSFASLASLLACADEDLVRVPEPPPEPAAPVEELPAEQEQEPAPPATSGDACADDGDCGDGSECVAGTCVGVGVLQVTLSFPVDADFDLHVVTPTGEEIYYGNPSAAGGVLDVDQCVVECGPGTHVENVFFNGALSSGVYTAYAVNFDGRDGGTFHLEVSGAASAALDGSLLPYPDELSADLDFVVP